MNIIALVIEFLVSTNTKKKIKLLLLPKIRKMYYLFLFLDNGRVYKRLDSVVNLLQTKQDHASTRVTMVLHKIFNLLSPCQQKLHCRHSLEL